MMAATSTSSFRTSQSQPIPPTTMPYSDNPLTQLPSVDFNFEDLRKRMADFTVKFDAFIERGRKRVLEERNEFRGRLGELHEEQRSTTAQITSLNTTLSTHSSLLSRESHERDEMHAQIHDLDTHRHQQAERRDRLRRAIAQTQQKIDTKQAAQREYADRMDGQARLNGPELAWWETYLGCRIEGAGDENLVRVVFVFPPPPSSSSSTAMTKKERESEREATMELKVPDTGAGGYSVVHCVPKLDQARVERVVARLNETRDIAVLLKGMRALFAEEMK